MEIYLDSSATTRPCAEAIEACNYAMSVEYGNPSSLHQKGFEAEKLVLFAKSRLAAALGCEESELFFTSGATEANNLALFGVANANRRRGRTIVTTAIEHPAVLEPAAALEQQGYCLKRLLPDKDGRYTPEQFAEAVDEDTILVSTMFVNNETGLILPISEIAKAVKKKNPNVLFHTDAVQGFLKLPLKLKNSGIDLLSVSGHKVFAPKGIGALYVRRGVRLIPLFYGGGQQFGLRSGTEPVPLIAAFGAAVDKQYGTIQKNYEHYISLKKHLLGRLTSMEDVIIRSHEGCAPHIVSLTVKGIRSEILLHFLEQKKVYVSSGSACGKGKPSHVLEALGVAFPDSDETVRLSFSPEITAAMLDEFVASLEEGLCVLQKRRRI